MKRITPNIFLRLKKGLNLGLKVLLTLFGIATGIIGTLAVTGTNFSLLFIILTGIALIFISLIVSFIKGQMTHLPDQIIFDDKIDVEYIVEYCTSTTLSQANSITKPYYGHEYVSNDKAESWRQKSPHSFLHILNKNGKLVASFGIIAIENSFFDQFVKGRLIDNELEPDDVLNEINTKKSNTLYISGVVVNNPDTPIGNRRAVVMIWAMLIYIKKYFGLRKQRDIYALAVSKSSENLLTRCGFQIVCEASERKDKLNLYYLRLTRENFDKIFCRIGDCSSYCTVKF